MGDSHGFDACVSAMSKPVTGSSRMVPPHSVAAHLMVCTPRQPASSLIIFVHLRSFLLSPLPHTNFCARNTSRERLNRSLGINLLASGSPPAVGPA